MSVGSGSVNPVRKEISYSDVNIKFTRHPVTKRLSVLKNDDAVKQAFKTLIFMNKFEMPYQPELGSNIIYRLFENLDQFTEHNIKKDIEEAASNFEPRVDLLDIQVKADEENNGFRTKIVYRTVNQIAPVELNVFLERVR
jgi:phage baseplate assembly protein W